MKHYIHACTCIVICCIGYLPAPPVYGEYLFSTGMRYDMFADDLDPESSGFEVSIPVGAAYRQKSYSLSLETAYISAHVTPDDEGEVNVSKVVVFTFIRGRSPSTARSAAATERLMEWAAAFTKTEGRSMAQSMLQCLVMWRLPAMITFVLVLVACCHSYRISYFRYDKKTVTHLLSSGAQFRAFQRRAGS